LFVEGNGSPIRPIAVVSASVTIRAVVSIVSVVTIVSVISTAAAAKSSVAAGSEFVSKNIMGKAPGS
jgi:hypothetical protein